MARDRVRPFLTRHRRVVAVAVDAVLIAASLADALLGFDRLTVLETTLGIVGAVGLVLRRRWPVVSLVLTLPVLFTGTALISAVVALYSVAERTRRRWIVWIAAAVVGAGYFVSSQLPSDLNDIVVTSVYGAMFVLGPTALGLLARTRRALSQRIRDLDELHALERRRTAREALEEERAALAREMHDAVAHQVSLIAVQAGALQVSLPDPDARATARTIRELSAQTLEELRRMVNVLRTPDSPAERHALPGISDLDALLRTSGIDVRSRIELDADYTPAQQRAIYRTVQEGLTNVRKHAPGAAVTLVAEERDGETIVRLRNGPAQEPLMPLPGAGHGLIGLRERAELLGGSFAARSLPDGGFELTLTLPLDPGRSSD